MSLSQATVSWNKFWACELLRETLANASHGPGTLHIDLNSKAIPATATYSLNSREREHNIYNYSYRPSSRRYILIHSYTLFASAFHPKSACSACHPTQDTHVAYAPDYAVRAPQPAARAHTLLAVPVRLTLEPVRLASAAAPKLLSWLAPLTTDDRDRGVFTAALTALAIVAACAAAPASATPWAAVPATEAACNGVVLAFHASQYT